MAKKKTRRRSQRRRGISGVEVVAVVAIAFALVAAIIIMINREASSSVAVAPTVAVSTPVRQIEVGTTADGYPYKGSPQAKVTMIEYSDYT